MWHYRMINLEDERLRRAEKRRRIRAKAINVANRHPLNRRAREMLLAAGEPVVHHQLHAIQLMFWRFEVVERLEGAVRHLETIEDLEARVEHLIEIQRYPYEAIERFEAIVPTVESGHIDAFKRFEAIRSAGFEAIKRLVTVEYYQLEADKRLEAINWRANRPSWAERGYEVGLMMGSMMECTPMAILRYLTVSVDVWDGCWHMKDYGGIEWTPEALADALLDTLMCKCDYQTTHFIDECEWAKWTTAEFFPYWEGI